MRMVIKFVMSVPGLFGWFKKVFKASKDGKITRTEAKVLFGELLVVIGVAIKK